MTSIQFKRLYPDVIVPNKASDGAACFDLYSHKLFIDNRGYTVHTGLSIALPPGYGLLIMPRSGLSTKLGLTLRNSVGVIDSDYRGEILIKFHKGYANAQAEIMESLRYGCRIAQALIINLPDVEWVEVEELPATERGVGGFGSTGVK